MGLIRPVVSGPGGQALKTLCVLLWVAFCLALMAALWQGRTALAFWHLRGRRRAADLVASDRAVERSDLGRRRGANDHRHGRRYRVTLHNVRNFDWRSNTDYTQRWETRDYDLDRLNSVDMVMSYWTRPAIAHMMISFGFDDGEHVVFSVEIRREKTESSLRSAASSRNSSSASSPPTNAT